MKQVFIPQAAFQTIRLVTGVNAFVDTQDFARIAEFDWYLCGLKYAATGKPSRMMHHEVLDMSDFSQHEVHHKNGVGLDNRRDNLQIVTRAAHLMTRGLQGNNASGFKGVSWKSPVGNRAGAWVAQIGYNGKKVHIGRFKCAEDAARAYDAKALELYGTIAQSNFLQ